MGTRLYRRRAVAAGVFSGCQTGAQYAHTGVARGDSTVAGPVSPVFARINAGHSLPATPASGGMMMAGESPGTVITNPTPAPDMVVAAPQVVGSSVTPVSYASAPVATPAQTAPSPMPMQPASMPMQSAPMPAPVMSTQMMPPTIMIAQAPAMPVQAPMPPAAIPSVPAPMTSAMPTAGGTPTLLMVQGPN